MAEPLAHLYDLALRALDDQQRRADALRSRIGPVLAAAALGVTLLSGPLLGATRAGGIVGACIVAIAGGGLAGMLGAAAYLLGTHHRTSFDIKAHRLIRVLRAAGALDGSTAFYDAMIDGLGRVHDRNVATIERLEHAFTWMLCSILVLLCGLALAMLVG